MNRRLLLLIAATVVVLLGTGLVYLYVQGADERADQRFDTVQVLTATQQIEIGEGFDEAAQAGKIQQTSVPSGAVLEGAITSLTDLGGTVATTTVFPGEQIVAQKFGSAAAATNLDIPEGHVAISVQLSDTARVAGFVNPGSEVAVFGNVTETPASATEGQDATADAATLVEPGTVMLLDRVKVIGVGSSVGASTSTTGADGTEAQTAEVLPTTLITLAVTQEQAQKLIYATTNGSIAFALLTPDSTVSRMPATTIDNLIG